MAIDIDQMINIDNDGNFKFGISKTLDNYTLDEIWENCYCGSNMPMAKGIYSGENASSWWHVGQDIPLTVNSVITNIRYIDCSAGNPDKDEYSEDGYYVKTLLLYTSSYNTYITTSTLSSFSMVLQLDMTRALLHFARSTGRSTSEVSPVWGDNKSYAPSRAMYFNKGSDWDENIDLQTSGEIIKIWAFQMIKYKDKYFILDMFNTRYPALLREPFASVGVVSCGFYSVDGTLGISVGQVTGDGDIEYNQSSASGLITCIDSDYHMYWQARTSTPVDYIEHTWYPTVQDVFQDNIKCYGCYFRTDKIYKPIIDGNNYVTGWTDVLSTPSEIDSWTGNTKHIVPDSKPGPGPSPGYDDDPWNGISFAGVGLGGGGAFARCYYMTSTELANLRSWMCGINVPEGFNPMAQIIGLSQVPVALSGDAPETVQFINSSAVYDPGVTSRVVDSGVSTQYSMGGPIKYSLGSVDIVRRMQERGEPYLDYSCQVELYLPLIGVFSLDTQAVMGRTIEAEAILDPISGTLAAYAWVSKDGEKLPVAYGSTTISVDLPVTAQQYSVSKAALKQANSQLGTSLLSSVATLVAAAVGAGKAEGSSSRVSGGASSMQGTRGMNSYAQASSIAASQAAISQTGNVVGDFMQWGRTIKQLQYGNNTAISGSFGGSVAQWSYPFNAYVKINRPRYEKPENYAHTQGVPCVQKKRIGDCTGFIQCIGVDVDNHIEGATDLERQAIQAALSSGIYAGGGSE